MSKFVLSLFTHSPTVDCRRHKLKFQCSNINLFIIFVHLAVERFDLLFSMFSSGVISQCFSTMLCNGSFLSFSIGSTFSDLVSSTGISSCNGLFGTTIFVDFPYVIRTTNN